MTTKLTPLQKKIVQNYCGGDLAHVSSMEEGNDCGDTLLTFLLREAGDADSEEEFGGMLATAINQLRSLRGDLA